METVYEYLKPSIPADHCRQSQATDLVKARIQAGFKAVRVLDLGCGAGSTVDFFKRCLPHAKWVGVDIEESPEVAQRRRNDAEFVTFDGVNLPFPDGEFDLIFSNQVLEHARLPEQLLAHVHRVLSPNGLFIGQTSQLEPYHSFSYWNFTVFGFKTICDAANLELLELRPSIDGITLMKRAYLGRPNEYSRWFAEESPINAEIEKVALKQNRNPQVINYRKLMFCGQFSFVCRRKKNAIAKAEAEERTETPASTRATRAARRARRGRRAQRVANITPSIEKHQLTLPGGMLVEYQCPSNFHIPRALVGTGLAGYEPATMAAFLACAESAQGVVFDVGANIGIYSLAAVSALQKKCVAFEPFPAAGDVLEDIASRYELPISLRRVALAATTGSKTFYLSARSDMSNSLNPDFRRHSGQILVETTTLDREASRWVPGIIKIDTETTEMDVLRGGRYVFSEIRPTVVVEVLGADLADEARSFFQSFGYSILELGVPEVWHRITGLEGDVVPGDRRNWLVSPHDLGNAFFDRAAFWAASIRALPLNE